MADEVQQTIRKDYENMGKESVTAIILTKNEEKNIEDCIISISDFAERTVVVDSGSDDDTVLLAKNLNAEVYEHKFENYARQFNWAIDNTGIDTKWILRLDADERFTPKLCAELSGLMKQAENGDINGISMTADLYFMGKCLKRGGKTRKRKIMLFKTGIGRIEDRKMDEHTILSCGTAIHAKNKFIHYDFKDLTTYINKLNWYATREMQDYFEYKTADGTSNNQNMNDKVMANVRKKKFGFYYKLPCFLRCWLMFIYSYIFRGNFLNGKEGYVYTYLYNFFYRTLVDAKIIEQQMTNKPFEETGDLK